MTYAIGEALVELRKLPAGFAQTCVTSPPYWGLRDYGHDGQAGLESTPEAYVARMVEIFAEVRRVLRDDGTLWLNLGDSYAGGSGGSGGSGENSAKQTTSPGSYHGGPSKLAHGLKPKDLVGIPWRVAFALQADGWYLRSDIIWAKPNPMPESVTDRPTKAHEYVFLLSKSQRYFYDADAVAEPATEYNLFNGSRGRDTPKTGANGDRNDAGRGSVIGTGTRNRRTVWTVPTAPFSGAHFACFPPKLIEPCIMAGAPLGGMVLDPFLGSGTTGMVAESLGRQWFGIELNPDYEPLIRERTKQLGLFGR